MPLPIPSQYPTLLIRKDAFERAGLTRQAFDERLGLTPDEFRVEQSIIAVGPIVEVDAVPQLIADLEAAGLTYFDDFFEFSGNWPEWLTLYAMTPAT